MRDIARNTWWPAILRCPPTAEPEQATIWRAMQTGGAQWVAALRAATDTVIDRIAWMAQDLQPRINTALELARAEIQELRVAQANAEAATETARSEIEALRASTSWRITAPLEALPATLLRVTSLHRVAGSARRRTRHGEVGRANKSPAGARGKCRGLQF
jgi:hypothetical protein